MEPLSLPIDHINHLSTINEYLFNKYDRKDDCIIEEDEYFDLNKCFIKSLNKEVILDVSIQILLNGEFLFSILYIEVVKYFYSIWNSPDNDPRFQSIINIISKHLIETSNLTSQEYNQKLNERNAGDIKGVSFRYYTWWLYVFYPLLPNANQLILKLMEIVYLDDAQDSLLYGIYQMKKEQLIDFFPYFLHHLNTFRCFDPNSTGTGAKKQMELIRKKIYN